MPLTRAEVEKIALLGRLLLSDEELHRMTVQLGDILGYMDLLARSRHQGHRADGPRPGNDQRLPQRRRSAES